MSSFKKKFNIYNNLCTLVPPYNYIFPFIYS